MNSSVIGKIEKARRYAKERNRITFNGLSVHFRGENGDHHIEMSNDKWRCTCDFFDGYGACAHTMALERILEGMLPPRITAASPMQPEVLTS
jgi:hypothetical protein